MNYLSRLMNRVFKHQICKNMEVYVDDMLVKSAKESDHLRDLQETFDVLKKYGMKLNLQKCFFRVNIGMFLGIMVTSQ